MLRIGGHARGSRREDGIRQPCWIVTRSNFPFARREFAAEKIAGLQQRLKQGVDVAEAALAEKLNALGDVSTLDARRKASADLIAALSSADTLGQLCSRHMEPRS